MKYQIKFFLVAPNGRIVYEIQKRKWWWPWWSYVATFSTKERAWAELDLLKEIDSYGKTY